MQIKTQAVKGNFHTKDFLCMFLMTDYLPLQRGYQCWTKLLRVDSAAIGCRGCIAVYIRFLLDLNHVSTLAKSSISHFSPLEALV